MRWALVIAATVAYGCHLVARYAPDEPDASARDASVDTGVDGPDDLGVTDGSGDAGDCGSACRSFEQIDTLPNGGRILWLSVAAGQNENLYAIVSRAGRLFRSTNRAASWQECEHDLGRLSAVVAVAADPKDPHVLVGAEGGVYLGTDSCTNWIRETDQQAHSFVVLDDGYLAGTEDGLVQSTGDGTWEPVEKDALKGMLVKRIVASDDVLYACSASAVARGSRNLGTWELVDVGDPTNYAINDLAIDAKNANRAFVLFNGRGDLWRTDDRGEEWTETTAAEGGTAVALDPNSSSLVAYMWHRVIHSSNGVNFPGDDYRGDAIGHALVSQLLFDPDSRLYAATETGLFMTDAVTEEPWLVKPWLNGNAGIQAWTINDIAVGTSGIFLATPGGLMHSTDHGATWLHNKIWSTKSLSKSYAAAVALSENERLWIGGEYLCRSTDEANSEFEYVYEAENADDYDIRTLAVSSTQVYAGTDKRLLIFEEDGPAPLKPLRVYSMNAAVNAILLDGARIWVATSSGVFFSDDDGVLFKERSDGLTGEALSLRLNNGELLVGTTGGLFALKNEQSWTRRGSSTAEVYALIMHDDRTLFAARSDGVYASADGGQSWTAHGGVNGIPRALATDGDTVLVGTTGYGLFSMPLESLSP